MDNLNKTVNNYWNRVALDGNTWTERERLVMSSGTCLCGYSNTELMERIVINKRLHGTWGFPLSARYDIDFQHLPACIHQLMALVTIKSYRYEHRGYWAGIEGSTLTEEA
jgi:hypothetical protein